MEEQQQMSSEEIAQALNNVQKMVAKLNFELAGLNDGMESYKLDNLKKLFDHLDEAGLGTFLKEKGTELDVESFAFSRRLVDRALQIKAILDENTQDNVEVAAKVVEFKRTAPQPSPDISPSSLH